MSNVQFGGRRFAKAVGAFAAGLGGAQAADAAVIFTPVDVDIPSVVTGDGYDVDLDGNAVREFRISTGDTTVTKVGDFAAGAGVLRDPGDNRAANLALGTLIGPGSGTFSSTGPDALNGTDAGSPVGHFQVSDGPGFIGVQFQIAGATHFGYVGYQGIGSPADGEGHIYALGYENVPATAIAAGDGIIPEPTSLCLLAAGATGLSLYRRRRWR